MVMRNEILDELLKDCKTPEDMFGKNGLLKQLAKGLLERMLDGELTHHLGYAKNARTVEKKTNYRNGTNSKTITTENGVIEIENPRDREGTFEPQIIEKGKTRFKGFDDKIISMYGRGMSTRDIQEHL